MRYFIFFLFIPSLIFGQTDTFQSIDLSDQIVVPKNYIIAKTEKPLKIDGKPEKTWDAAPFSDPFIDIEGEKKPKYQTRVKMLWDESFLYVYAELEEPHIWGNLRQRDTIIYLNNDFEVFINSSEKTEAYAEIEMNALNTVWDLLLNKPYRSGGYANFKWNLDELKTAVHIDGTLNNATDVDKKWSVEMAIPMDALIELKNDKRKKIEEGDQWRMNFSRVQWDYELTNGSYSRKKVDGKLVPEYNWVWSNQTKINMHIPENWGIVQFTEKNSVKEVTFREDPDFLLKQTLFALFRETNWGALVELKSLNHGVKRNLTAKYDAYSAVNVEFLKTNTGFEFTLKSDNSNKRYSIDEQGRFIELEQHDADFKFATWAHGDKTMDTEKWTAKLAMYDSLGISDILVGGSPEFLQELVFLARERKMRIHGWMWTLNRPNDTIANKHPEWYAVNRDGENSLDYRAYVDYYQWLSPFHPEAREYIKSNVRKLLEVEGLASIHLDYVRYVDVILGADLQPKYGLVQDHEMPEYDYGYHPIARQQFKELFGIDPMEMTHPELSTEWRQFRLNAITTLVNEIALEVHSENQRLSAAVFPFPEMSRQMVRQAWDDWNLDCVFPMIYHNFYRENIDWIGFATEQGLRDVDYPLYTGLYLPGFASAEDFQKAIELAEEKGASGVCFFTVDGIKSELKQVLIQRNTK